MKERQICGSSNGHEKQVWEVRKKEKNITDRSIYLKIGTSVEEVVKFKRGMISTGFANVEGFVTARAATAHVLLRQQRARWQF